MSESLRERVVLAICYRPLCQSIAWCRVCQERADVAIAIVLGEAANAVQANAERHRVACDNCRAEGLKDAAALASYAARCVDDAAADILALKEPKA